VRKGGKVIASGPHGLSDHQLRKLFSAVDGDQSGAVSINELTKFLLKDEAVVQRS
jgi:Ca2+-binding EF-hand superfamily protein